MLSKKVIKDIQSLGHKNGREELGVFVAEGDKIVKELLQVIPQKITEVYATKKWMENHIEFKNVTEVSEQELEKISSLKTPHEALCIVKKFEVVAAPFDTFVLYLDAIQDPGNFGTIIRIADWFGVKNIVCTEGTVDVYNAKVVQASMASIARVNVFYDKKNEWLKNVKNQVFATVLTGTSVYDQTKVENGVLLIGNESKGLSETLLSFATKRITIPKKGEAESLNAAVATGIILSHLKA